MVYENLKGETATSVNGCQRVSDRWNELVKFLYCK